MNLTITPEAKEFIESKMTNEDNRVFLDYENGDSAFSNEGYSCGLDYAYRLVLLDKDNNTYDTSSYTLPLETSVGTVWMNKSGQQWLEENTKLSFNKSYYSLNLSGDNGQITNNIAIENR